MRLRVLPVPESGAELVSLDLDIVITVLKGIPKAFRIKFNKILTKCKSTSYTLHVEAEGPVSWHAG